MKKKSENCFAYVSEHAHLRKKNGHFWREGGERGDPRGSACRSLEQGPEQR